MTKPVIIEYRKGPLAGAQYEVESAAKAAKLHPDAVIIATVDGTMNGATYTAPDAEQTPAEPKTAKAAKS